MKKYFFLYPVLLGLLLANCFLIMRVEGDSMKNKLNDGQFILILKNFLVPKYKQGDVAIINVLNKGNIKITFVKEIVGCPGDTVTRYASRENCSAIMITKPNKIQHTYPRARLTGCKDTIFHSKISAKLIGQYYLLGNNYLHSTDSRNFSSVTKNQLRGKVIFRF